MQQKQATPLPTWNMDSWCCTAAACTAACTAAGSGSSMLGRLEARGLVLPLSRAIASGLLDICRRGGAKGCRVGLSVCAGYLQSAMFCASAGQAARQGMHATASFWSAAAAGCSTPALPTCTGQLAAAVAASRAAWEGMLVCCSAIACRQQGSAACWGWRRQVGRSRRLALQNLKGAV